MAASWGQERPVSLLRGHNVSLPGRRGKGQGQTVRTGDFVPLLRIFPGSPICASAVCVVTV